MSAEFARMYIAELQRQKAIIYKARSYRRDYSTTEVIKSLDIQIEAIKTVMAAMGHTL